MKQTHLLNEQLESLVLGTLQSGESTAVKLHLAGCVRCKTALDAAKLEHTQFSATLDAQLNQLRPSQNATFIHLLRDLPNAPKRQREPLFQFLPGLAALAALFIGAFLIRELIGSRYPSMVLTESAVPGEARLTGIAASYEGAISDVQTDFSQILASSPLPNFGVNLSFESDTLQGQSNGRELSTGWFMTGPSLENYRMLRDSSTATKGSASLRLESYEPSDSFGETIPLDDPRAFGAIVQSISADGFRGQRVWFSADIKTDALDEWAGLWARVDGPGGGTLQFDNMHARSITGTTDWERYNIVFDVPFNADVILFGALLVNSGTAWVDNLQFVSVNSDVPLTTTGGGWGGYDMPSEPYFLNFEDGIRSNLRDPEAPYNGWFVAGSNLGGYQILRDVNNMTQGEASARFVAIEPQPDTFGMMMQAFEADNWRGSRVRLSADIKTQDLSFGGGMWLRVDSETFVPLQFDNMFDRRLTGTRDWQRYEIVFDVPEESAFINIGLIMIEDGIMWMDDVQLERVDTSVPLTTDNRFLEVGPKFCGQAGTNLSVIGHNLDFECGSANSRFIARWVRSGTAQAQFDAALDADQSPDGSTSATYFSTVDDIDGYGTLMQRINPQLYLGERLRISADLRAENLEAPAYLWAALNREPADEVLNEAGRVENSAEWQRVEIFIDIPLESAELDFGIFLNGPGQIWIDNVTIERVGDLNQ